MDYTERLTGMMTNKFAAVLQNHDSSDEIPTKQFLITLKLFHHQITAV